MERAKKRLDRWLQARIPVGMPVEGERKFLGYSLGLSALWAALCYLVSYLTARMELYVTAEGEQVLNPSARMAPFGEVFRFVPLGYVLAAVLLIQMGFVHQGYHRQGSMSVYLMRRLSDPWEYPRRCWTLPLAGVGICLALAVLTAALCYHIYVTCTPASCLEPGQWARFWSAMIGR